MNEYKGRSELQIVTAGKQSGSGADSLLPAASCIHPQILYTVPVLQKKKRAKQPMQVRTSTMDMPMKMEAALNALDGMALNSVKLP